MRPHAPTQHHDATNAFVFSPTRIALRHSLVAYFTGETLESLLTVDDVPELTALRGLIPPGKYTTARIARHRVRPEGSGPPLFADQKPPSVPAAHLVSTAPRLPLYTIDPQNDSFPSSSPSTSASAVAAELAYPPPHPPTDVRLPALKPPPWSEPPRPEDEFRTRQPDLNCAQSQSLRRNHTIDLAPLIYLRKRPYPPRNVADDDVLQRFDCGIV